MINFLRNSVTQDLPLKLVSLALAVLIWITITVAIRRGPSEAPGANIYSRTFHNQPVLVVSSGEDVSRYRVKPGEVDVTVQGVPGALRNLQGHQVHARVYLSGFNLTSTNRARVEVTTPPGFTYVSVVPADVEIVRPPAPAVPP